MKQVCASCDQLAASSCESIRVVYKLCFLFHLTSIISHISGLSCKQDGGSVWVWEVWLSSQKQGRWEHLGVESAASVPKSGTVGAFGYGKCAFRPKNRDGGSVWVRKVRLPSQKQGRWERLGMESVAIVPKSGTLGAFRWGKCGYRPEIRDVGNTLGMLGVLWVDVGSYFEVE